MSDFQKRAPRHNRKPPRTHGAVLRADLFPNSAVIFAIRNLLAPNKLRRASPARALCPRKFLKIFTFFRPDLSHFGTLSQVTW